jgi:hypothetical protein
MRLAIRRATRPRRCGSSNAPSSWTRTSPPHRRDSRWRSG